MKKYDITPIISYSAPVPYIPECTHLVAFIAKTVITLFRHTNAPTGTRRDVGRVNLFIETNIT